MRKQFQVSCATPDGNVILGTTNTTVGIENIVKQFINSNEGNSNVIIKENFSGRYIHTNKYNRLIDKLITAYWYN